MTSLNCPQIYFFGNQYWPHVAMGCSFFWI